MAGLDQHLKHPEYANWVKNTLALKFTLDILKAVVEKELQNIKASITYKCPPEVECSCNVDTASNCPNNVCNVLKDRIIQIHRTADPSFPNTNAKNWKKDAWEIAKCFMPPFPRYKSCTPSDIDFSAVMNIIINCKHFDGLVSCDLNQDGNIFCEARNMRNMLMHSASLKITGAVFQQNLDQLINLLSCFNDRPSNTPETLEKFEQLKEGQLDITLDVVIEARKNAILAIWEEFDKEKQEINDFVDQNVEKLRHEIETTSSIWKASQHRLISNFIKGCKQSLIRLVESKWESEKPKRYQQHEWNLGVFLNKIELNQDVEPLLDRHKRLLYPEDGSSSDTNIWDIFLLCHILSLQTTVDLPKPLIEYVNALKATRDKILINPNSIVEEDLETLFGFLDDPLRTEIKCIFAVDEITDDALQLLSVLKSWQQNEDNMECKQISMKALKQIEVQAKEVGKMKVKLAEDRRVLRTFIKMSQTPENQSETDNLLQKISSSSSDEDEDMNIETCVEIKPRNCDPEEEEQIQCSITSEDSDDNISGVEGSMAQLQEQLDLETAQTLKGSIILKVTCKSITNLIRFWDSCMDGSAVRALSNMKDEYRKILGCSTLDFDIVLTKKEVHRCMTNLVERMSYRLLDENISKEVQAMLHASPGLRRIIPSRICGEEEVTRVFQNLKLMAEGFMEGKMSAFTPYLQEMIKHSKDKNEGAFNQSILNFAEATNFVGRIPDSLIEQVHQDFHMIFDEPEFGDLVVAKLES